MEFKVAGMRHGKQSKVDLTQTFDVLVIGGGNAALCAAMPARKAGAEVLVLESSPEDFRGGNSRHTRNLRYMHDRANDFLTGGSRSMAPSTAAIARWLMHA